MRNVVENNIPSHLLWEDNKDLNKKNNIMGKDDFMHLLVTQLQHQDPLNPMDAKDFSAQLAQFTSLEKLTNIEKVLSKKNEPGKEVMYEALKLIGKKVSALKSQIDLIRGKEVAIPVLKEHKGQIAKVSIYNEKGQLVREIELEDHNKLTDIIWDGKDQKNEPLPSGKYYYTLWGIDEKGQLSRLGDSLSGKVSGVSLDQKEPILYVKTKGGEMRVPLSSVQEVELEEANKSQTISSLKEKTNQRSDKVETDNDFLEYRPSGFDFFP